MNNRKRLFTDEFNIGDEVAIIRHEHGWEDGAITGTIISLAACSATVKSGESQYSIDHPRDISLIRKGNGWKKKNKGGRNLNRG